jgi:hypothetical protein
MRGLPLLVLLCACGVEPTDAPAPAETPRQLPAPVEPGLLHPEALAAELIGRFDRDGDGLISHEEHARYARPEPRFDALDLDASGALDAAELLRALRETAPEYNTHFTEPEERPGGGQGT